MSNVRRPLGRDVSAEAEAALRALAAEMADVMRDATGTAAMARCFVDRDGRVTIAWNLYTTPATSVTGATVPVVEGREVLS